MLCNKQLHNLHYSSFIMVIKRRKETGHASNTHGRGEKLVQNCDWNMLSKFVMQWQRKD
jgi:hypothetical protein